MPVSPKKLAYPKPSASVLLARDAQPFPEFLMVRRRAGDAFGDSFAFPGGVIDANEANSNADCRGRTEEEVNALFNLNDGLSYYTAVIRELFEETGILLAEEVSGGALPDIDTLEKSRRLLNDGVLPWSDFLREHSLCMCGEQLHYFAYWETPTDQPKRWSTRFFLAQAPGDQLATHDGNEVTDHQWQSASDSLNGWQDGSFPMPLPTVRILRTLVDQTTVQALLDWADEKAATPIEKIRPKRVPGTSGRRYAIKGDPDYPGV